MADIKKELNDIKNAVYGREVRGAIHDGIKKINDEAENATDLSESAKHQVENIQQQVNQLVVEGDSSVEAAQARVDADGNTFATLKERLDTKETQFASQLAQTMARTNGIVSVEETGAIGDFDFNSNTGTDNTQMFLDALNRLTPEGTLYIPEGFYYITGHIPFHCNVEAKGTLVIPNHINGTFFTFPKEEEIILTGSEIFYSLVKGQNTIRIRNTGNVPPRENLVDYYFTLTSNEKLIERLGSERYSPYTKNETGEFVKVGNNDDVILKTRLIHTYENLNSLSVSLSKKMKRKVINNLKIIRANTGENEHNQKVFVISGNNLELNNFFFDNYSGSFSNCLLLENAANIHLNNIRIKNVDDDTDDTYPILNFNSAYIYINDYWYGANYPTSARGYAARHGNYVYFTNCEMNGIDDHFGHNYYIDNCKFTGRGITYAGSDMTIRKSEFLNCFSAFSLRFDTPYAEGKLLFDDVDFIGCLRTVELFIQANDPLNRKFTRDLKLFDDIEFRNCRRTDSLLYGDYRYDESCLIQTSAIGGIHEGEVEIGKIKVVDCELDIAIIKLSERVTHNIKSITFRNVEWNNEDLPIEESHRSLSFILVRGNDKIGKILFENCNDGGLHCDFWSFGSAAIDKVIYINCTFEEPNVMIVNDTSNPNGELYYIGCLFDGVEGHYPRGFLYYLKDNIFRNLIGYTLTPQLEGSGTLIYSQNNILDINTYSNQAPILTDYVNSDYYKKQ